MNQTIRLVTNVGKTQISDDGEFFKLSRIPVTVDDAVMNGLHYPEDENEKGIPSLAGRVMTLGHPKNAAGEHVSASDGDALVNQFSGGSVTRTYLKNGVHYVDAKIRKSTLKAQPNGEWFYNQLENQKPIGVSTGLFSQRELKEGTNKAGKKYRAIARNQRYDHLALLHESEPPAGGKDTFINFNAEDTDITINVDECIVNTKKTVMSKIMTMLGLENNESSFSDTEQLISSKLKAERTTSQDEYLYPQEIYDTFFIYKKDGTMLKQTYLLDEGVITFVGEPIPSVKDVDWKPVKTDLNTNEDDANMRKFIIDQLTAKGISVNAEATDEQLQAELTKALATNSAPVGGEQVPAWAQALTANMDAMAKKVDAMEKSKMTDEEEAKAKKAKAIAANQSLGMTEDEAKLLPNSLLDKFYAQCGGITGNAHSGFGGRQSEGVAEIDLNKLMDGGE
jgi:hypothetical protein